MTYAPLPPQFILWKSVPQMPPKKPRKVPCTIDGSPTDPLNPDNFMDYQTAVTVAASHGFNVGFTLTENDPFFLLDLDDIKTPEGEWDQWSQSICAQFPNAAIEMSVFGNGVHVMGKCDASVLVDRKRKFAQNKGEFYTSKRFVALGRGFVGGDLNIDWTPQLLQVVPKRDEADGKPVNYDGPVSEYTGPSDDNQLIAKMLNTAGSVASQFGDKASLRDLWACNVPALAKAFPSPSEDLFDRSSADAALMSHLAFWTGKDFERMDRLFRMSGLMRDKYAHRNDYRMNTISGAIRHCRNVYSVAQHQSENKKASQQAAIIAGELMTVQEQQEYFKGCFYVTQLNKIMIPDGDFLDKAQFRAIYGGYEFIMKADGTKPTRNAFEAFTENMVHDFPKVSNITFRADMPFQSLITDPDGRTAVNTYQPREPRAVTSDPAPFLSLVNKLLPNPHDSNILLSYMAAVAQYPGRKFLWSPVVIGTQGNGKSTLINILQYVVDGVIQGVNDDETRYSLTMTAQHIDDRFNGDMHNKTLCVVHEMHTDSFKDQRARQDYLKTLITEPSITIERKRIDKFNARNCANFFFCSNHRDAVRLDSNERRFAVFYTAQQDHGDMLLAGMTTEYFVQLWDWLRNRDGFAICNHFLKTFPIPDDTNPAKGAQKAPMTSATDQAVWESRTHAEQIILQAIEAQEQGFKGGWVSTLAVKKLFEQDGSKAPYGRALSNLLRNLGYTGGYQSSSNIFQENGRPRLWVLKHQALKLNEGGKGWADHYSNAQGYDPAPAMV